MPSLLIEADVVHPLSRLSSGSGLIGSVRTRASHVCSVAQPDGRRFPLEHGGARSAPALTSCTLHLRRSPRPLPRGRRCPQGLQGAISGAASSAVPWSARAARIQTDSPRMFERSERSERSEFAARPQGEQRSGVGAERRPPQHEPMGPLRVAPAAPRRSQVAEPPNRRDAAMLSGAPSAGARRSAGWAATGRIQ